MAVRGCCCFFSLKTGCIIISVYSLMVSLLLLVTSSMDLKDTLIDDEEDVTEKYDEKEKDPITRGMSWTFLTILSLHALASILLLVGVMKEIRAIVLIWIIADIIFLTAVVSAMTLRLFEDPRVFTASIGKRLCSIIVGVYFLIVVKSFYRDLKEKQNNNASYL